ncbi:MAG: glycogen synthase GlgA [Candidatus Omnitrophota bacterium]
MGGDEKDMRIVFVAAEVFPFAKTGGLADVCGTLPLELERLGHEVFIIMPGYRGTSGIGKFFNERACVLTIGKNLRVYLLQHPEFFSRTELYGDTLGDYPDNILRFAYFCHGALHLIKDIGKPVDIIHCHDWQTGLIPALLKENYACDPLLERARTVFTVHNLAYQGVFPREDMPKTGLDEKLFNPEAVEFYGKVNFLKTGLVFADRITTVSPQYAKEIQTTAFGCGLDGVMAQNRERLSGILNGLDYELWDPQNDPLIAPQYSSRDSILKKVHKEKLQQVYGLTVDHEIPVFGSVGRLCYQKGLDLLESAFEDLMQRPVQFVLIGVGESKYQRLLLMLAKKYAGKCGVVIRYDESLAHTVYAGADFFLMPSVYEPCGLTQMISQRYGTIPVVSAVGGLVDTVTDFTCNERHGNGFVMPSYSVAGMLDAIDRACAVFQHKEVFHDLVVRVMGARWTWESSAQHYIACYEQSMQVNLRA